MKPLYWILIAVGIALIGFLIYINKSKSSQSQQDLSNQQQSVLTPGGTSTAAQIINSLFPFFQTGVGALGSDGKKSLSCGKTGQPRCTSADLKVAGYSDSEITNIMKLQSSMSSWFI